MVFKYANKILILNDREKYFSNIIFKNDDLFDYNVIKYKEYYIKYVVNLKKDNILLIDIIPSKQYISSWTKLYNNINSMFFFLKDSDLNDFKDNIKVLNDIVMGEVFKNTNITVVTNKINNIGSENEKLFQNALDDFKKSFPNVKYIDNISKSTMMSLMHKMVEGNTSRLSTDKFHISEQKPMILQRGWSN